jgi:hypothetical protein
LLGEAEGYLAEIGYQPFRGFAGIPHWRNGIVSFLSDMNSEIRINIIAIASITVEDRSYNSFITISQATIFTKAESHWNMQ